LSSDVAGSVAANTKLPGGGGVTGEKQ